jgi:HK97 family phage prohead protease
MQIERRSFGEIRTAGRQLFGIAAPFGKAADIAGMFKETIMRGAFAATLAKRSDVLALADHRPDALLGRTRSGTLRLQEGAAGLEYQLDLPATSDGSDILELARRGDLGGVSIGFTADAEAWPDKQTRQLRAVTLHEISVIRGHAAYPDTTIAVRSRDAVHDTSASQQMAAITIGMRRRLISTL